MDRIALLSAYVRLVELGTLTAVAKEMRIKQSTVSKWLAALEEEVGGRLLDRTTRALRPTEAGTRFYAGAKRVLETYEEAIADASEQDGLQGRIRISAPVVFGELFVVPVLSELLLEHEGLEVDLVLDDRYVRLVEDGFQLAVRIGVPVDSTLTAHHLGRSARKLVASPAYLEARGTPRTPHELASHACLPHSRLDERATWTFERGEERFQVAMSGRSAINHSRSALVWVRDGLGIGLLPPWLVDADLAEGALVELMPEYRAPDASIQALTPPGRFVAPRVRVVIDRLRLRLGA